MMLCKLSLKNIRKSFKDYAIYFFTLILGVSIFYVFNALESQTVMMNVSNSTRDIIKLMNGMMSGVSVFVSFILGFLIIYASRFLIKRRNKEFGIYLTLGMSKRKISTILLFETLFIGVVSLFIGLLAGVFLSQFMSLLVASMFEADVTSFAFVFSKSAALKCLIYFGIIYAVVMIFNTVNVSKCKLIDLIQSGRKSEEIKLKNPVLCVVIFLVSLCALSYAYYLVTGGVENLQDTKDIIVPIVIGAVSTFFIFWSMSGLILRIVKRCKNMYYRGLNSFVIRQVSSKINTMVMAMTVICLMLFVTICVLSSALSLKNSMTSNLTSLAPADIQIYKVWDRTEEDSGLEVAEDSRVSVRETLERMDFYVDKYFKDILEFNIYSSKDVLFSNTLGSYYETAHSKYPMMTFDTAELFIKLSDYNKVAKLYGNEILSLESDEYILLADYDSIVDIRDEGLKLGTSINLLGKTYYPKTRECIPGFVYMSSNHINMGIFVVPDEALDESIRYENLIIANYDANDDDGKQKIEDKVLELSNHPYIFNTSLEVNSKIAIYEASVGLGACATFIGLYLGIIFLVSSAAILALKEMTESSDNKLRYKMLRKLGADEKMINNALFKQTLIFFVFPLVLAIIHSIFGIMFCDFILSTFGNEKLLVSIVMTAILIVVIYGGYFIITYLCSKNIIKE